MLQLEPVLVFLVASVLLWLVYRFFLQEISPARHKNLRRHFLNLLAHLAILGVLFTGYTFAQRGLDLGDPNQRLASYLGLATLISGAIVSVKLSRIFMFEYLFLGHMKEGVPVLIVNLFSLLLSIGIAGWFATDIFGVRLAPVLATSAVFSLILGLALQDTLGNLFAGVALQLDKPYAIGDWIEIVQSGQTYVGQVEEITWRATTLIGLFDELLVLPNRLMGAAEISNFTSRNVPLWRGQTFRIPHSVDIADVKQILSEAVAKVAGVRTAPSPMVLIRESTESWLVFRCSYAIDFYPDQFRVGSDVITAVTTALKQGGYSTAAQRVQLIAEPGKVGHS